MRGRMVITAVFLYSVDCTWSAEGVIMKTGTQAQHSLADPLWENIRTYYTSSSIFSYTNFNSFSSKWRDSCGSIMCLMLVHV